MSDNFVTELDHDFPDPESEPNVLHNPNFEELRSFSDHLETTTEFGSPAYISEKRSRSADQTKNDQDHEFRLNDIDQLSTALERVKEMDLVCLDRVVGRHPDHSYVCRLYVPKEYGRIALAWGKLLDSVNGSRDPDFQTLQLPDFDNTCVRIFVNEGVTYVLGSDYTGEAKKSFLRLFMHRAKQSGGLGLHAGTKNVHVRKNGDIQDIGQAFLGLSGTGKSTLTSHGCGLSAPEYTRMLQDDVCALLPNGSIVGSEGNGLYIKTDGLDELEQPELHHATIQSHTVLENVAIGSNGSVNFDDDSITSNGRGVVSREDLPSASQSIDLDDVDQIFFITRNPLMPPIGQLTPEQASVAFMLGESIETSAGDPENAGEAVRVVGTNPFIIGSEGREGNRFYDLICENNVTAYLLNTGSIGDGAKSIEVEESVTILTEVARGTVEWKYDNILEFDLPETLPKLDIKDYYPPDYIEDYNEKLSRLRNERRVYLQSFDDLRTELQETVY